MTPEEIDAFTAHAVQCAETVQDAFLSRPTYFEPDDPYSSAFLDDWWAILHRCERLPEPCWSGEQRHWLSRHTAKRPGQSYLVYCPIAEEVSGLATCHEVAVWWADHVRAFVRYLEPRFLREDISEDAWQERLKSHVEDCNSYIVQLDCEYLIGLVNDENHAMQASVRGHQPRYKHPDTEDEWLTIPAPGDDAAGTTEQAGGDDEDSWIRITEAARLVGENKGTISRWLKEKHIKDNGLSNSDRRVSLLSLTGYCIENGISLNET